MKIKSLYFKILFSFFLVLVVTEILIFAALFLGASDELPRRFKRMTETQTRLVRVTTEDRLRAEPRNSTELQEWIESLARVYDSRVWLISPDGKVWLSSTHDPLPPPPRRYRRVGEAQIGFLRPEECLDQGDEHSPFGQMELRFVLKDGYELRIRVRRQGAPSQMEPWLPFAFIGIALLVVVLIIPISVWITGPIKELQRSVRNIAERGDLSHRTTVTGGDELGELGRCINDLAERVERLLSGNRELTANISHELRSPLARIRVVAEMLRFVPEEKREHYLESVEMELSELDRLISEIMELSRHDLHESDPQSYAKIDLAARLRQEWHKVTPFAESRALVLSESGLDATAKVELPERDLLLLLSNLLNNAAKYAPEGSCIKIELHQAQTDHEPISSGRSVEVRISNLAPDMTPELYTQLFDPFVRGGEGGFGLGLAISKKIARKYRGSLRSELTLERFDEEVGGVIGESPATQRLTMILTLPIAAA